MRTRMAWLAVLSLALAAVPAYADYENGPINGTTDGYNISFGFIVSDSFVADANTVAGFMLGTWEFPGDVVMSLDWSITSQENGGTVYGSGTAKGKDLTDQFISTNQYGYDVDRLSISGLNVAVTSGSTYWLNLENATIPGGDPVLWDENSGKGCQSNGCPSQASETSVGTIASEAFTINGGSGTTPEPGSLTLFASGVVGVIGVLRRKLF
jgi:PEP-CTERM motif